MQTMKWNLLKSFLPASCSIQSSSNWRFLLIVIIIQFSYNDIDKWLISKKHVCLWNSQGKACNSDPQAQEFDSLVIPTFAKTFICLGLTVTLC